MDECSVDVHLLSLTTPGVQSLERQAAVDFARMSNDRLAQSSAHPTRFAGLAAVAPQDPDAAAAEIDRAMTQLGFNGVLINSYTNGEYLDHSKFEPIFAALDRHRAPLYLHPRVPAPAMVQPYVDYGLTNAIWGFAILLTTTAVILALPGDAFAHVSTSQAAPLTTPTDHSADETPNSHVLGDIVVTAQRRSESSQRAAIPLAFIDGAAVASAGVTQASPA